MVPKQKRIKRIDYMILLNLEDNATPVERKLEKALPIMGKLKHQMSVDA